MWAWRMFLMMIVIVGTIAGVSAELSSEHSISIDGSVDIPDQTVSTEFGEATISEVGKEETGNTLAVSADAPANDSYVLRIIDNQQRNLESRSVAGSVDEEFILDRFEPGTYIVAITKNNGDDAEAVEPFVVEGYRVTQQTADVTKGADITIEIKLTKINNRVGSPQAVNVTLFKNEEVRTTEAKKVENLQYNATFETDSLSTGEYEFYTGVESGGSIYGYDELIGLSSKGRVTIKAQSTASPTSTTSPTVTSTPTEADDSTIGGGGGGVGPSESGTETSMSTSVKTTEKESLSPTEPPTADETEPVNKNGSGTPKSTQRISSTIVNETRSETPAQTESIETTATGTPVIPSLTVGLMIVFSLLLGQRLRK